MPNITTKFTMNEFLLGRANGLRRLLGYCDWLCLGEHTVCTSTKIASSCCQKGTLHLFFNIFMYVVSSWHSSQTCLKSTGLTFLRNSHLQFVFYGESAKFCATVTWCDENSALELFLIFKKSSWESPNLKSTGWKP